MGGQIAAAWILASSGVQIVSLPIGGLTVGSFGVSLAITVFVVVLVMNAVNFIDGLDGLAAGVVGIGTLAFFIYSYVLAQQTSPTDYFSIAGMLSAVVLGAIAGFLPHNFSPAKIFMGDTGSLSFGGSLAAVAIIVKHEIVLAIVGGLFVLETVSVIIQVISFKLTGKRVFMMAPIHHHFEKKGWAESTIVIRFWIISIILALIGLATLKLR